MFKSFNGMDVKDKTRRRMERRAQAIGNCRVIEKICKNQQGYGTISLNGTSHFLHRVVYWIASKYDSIYDIPRHLQVAHLCKNLTCIVPEHYKLTTASENAAHKRLQGTHREGDTHHSSKITFAIAQAIANSWDGIKTKAQRAEQFNVSIGIVTEIDNRRAWKSVIHPNMKTAVCNKHRSRRRQQDIYSTADVKVILTRLENSSQKMPSGCWHFNGKFRDRPYLSIFHQTKAAGRWACIVSSGVLEPDQLALHSCGFHLCVNPHHLRWGSAKENANDKRIHDTMVQSFSDNELLRMYRERDLYTAKELMSKYCLGRSTAYQIKKGTYKRLQRLI